MKKITEDGWAMGVAAISVVGVSVGVGWQGDFRLTWDTLTFFVFGLIVSGGVLLHTHRVLRWQTAMGYVLLFGLVATAHHVTQLPAIKQWGLETVLFSLAIGLLISNVGRVPEWLTPWIQTELYVKIGLVLMGTSIVFGDVMKAGSWGLVQSLLVVLGVWQFCFWLGKRFGLDDEMRTLLASAVSICGVSAAIATAGAIEGDSKKLSVVISLVMAMAIPMMLLMPPAAQAMHLSPAVAGAWLGGTIDTTGAVVAAGNALGEEALTYATVVKFSQNVLLGLAAFAISIYWSYRQTAVKEKPTAAVIWQRFPKFVIGFVAASLVFSFLLPPTWVSEAKPSLKNMQTFWFSLAFVCIGLETRFASLVSSQHGRPAWVFVLAQLFNIAFTLLVAALLFG